MVVIVAAGTVLYCRRQGFKHKKLDSNDSDTMLQLVGTKAKLKVCHMVSTFQVNHSKLIRVSFRLHFVQDARNQCNVVEPILAKLVNKT